MLCKISGTKLHPPKKNKVVATSKHPHLECKFHTQSVSQSTYGLGMKFIFC